MKWIIFRLAVCFYLRKELGKHDYSWRWCWSYSDSFDNFFDDVEWKTLIEDAQDSALEELSCWD